MVTARSIGAEIRRPQCTRPKVGGISRAASGSRAHGEASERSERARLPDGKRSESPVRCCAGSVIAWRRSIPRENIGGGVAGVPRERLGQRSDRVPECCSHGVTIRRPRARLTIARARTENRRDRAVTPDRLGQMSDDGGGCRMAIRRRRAPSSSHEDDTRPCRWRGPRVCTWLRRRVVARSRDAIDKGRDRVAGCSTKWGGCVCTPMRARR